MVIRPYLTTRTETATMLEPLSHYANKMSLSAVTLITPDRSLGQQLSTPWMQTATLFSETVNFLFCHQTRYKSCSIWIEELCDHCKPSCGKDPSGHNNCLRIGLSDDAFAKWTVHRGLDACSPSKVLAVMPSMTQRWLRNRRRSKVGLQHNKPTPNAFCGW